MRTKNFVAALVALTACGKGGKDEGGGGGGDGKGGCQLTAKKVADINVGKSVGVFTPFSFSLGASKADVQKACPNFFEDEEDKKKSGNFFVGEIIGEFGESNYAQARIELIADQVSSVSYTLPGAEIQAALTKAWGEPKVSTGGHAHAWFDEAKGLRAILKPPTTDTRRELTISSYQPIAAFLETDTKRIAWKPEAVLGKQPADLAKAFPQYLDKTETSAAVKAQTKEMMKELDEEVKKLGVDTSKNADLPEFELPASPYAYNTSSNVMLYTNDDKSVRSYGVWFHTLALTPEYHFPQSQAEIVKTMDSTWGASKKVKDVIVDRTTWLDPKRGLRVTSRIEKPDNTELVYSRYTPLATFFGAPGFLFGIEKPERPFLGATPQEIKDAYGKTALSIKHDEVANTITMAFPATDYESDSAQLVILMFVRDKGKVDQWHTSIPFRDYAPAEAEYRALLEAKLGKGKPGDRGHIFFGKKPKVDAQFSDITHELDIEVSAK